MSDQITIGEVQNSVDAAIFRKLWAISAVLATIFVIPITLWGEQLPWLMAIPVVICVLAGIYLEIKTELPPSATEAEGREATVSTLPSEFVGLSKHRKDIGLYIETEKPPPETQMNLFGVEEPVGKIQKKVILLRDDQGRKFTLVECDRFMAKVNTVIEDDVKRAAEHAFKTGWKRIEELAKENPDIGRILNDPLVLDAVKSDFHSNVSICMAKAGDFAAKRFIEESSDSTASSSYRITQDKQKRASSKVPKP